MAHTLETPITESQLLSKRPLRLWGFYDSGAAAAVTLGFYDGENDSLGRLKFTARSPANDDNYRYFAEPLHFTQSLYVLFDANARTVLILWEPWEEV